MFLNVGRILNEFVLQRAYFDIHLQHDRIEKIYKVQDRHQTGLRDEQLQANPNASKVVQQEQGTNEAGKGVFLAQSRFRRETVMRFNQKIKTLGKDK